MNAQQNRRTVLDRSPLNRLAAYARTAALVGLASLVLFGETAQAQLKRTTTRTSTAQTTLSAKGKKKAQSKKKTTKSKKKTKSTSKKTTSSNSTTTELLDGEIGCMNRLNLDAKGHSRTNAYLFSLVCHYMYPHAYRSNPPTFKWFKPLAQERFEAWGMKVDLRQKGNMQFVVMSNKKAIIVGFRGSDAFDSKDAIEDWILTNGDATQRLVSLWGTVTDAGLQKSPGVHSGFFKRYKGIRNQVNDLIAKHGGKSKKLFITGHSMGAALATLCAIDQGFAIDRLSKRRFVAHGVYTFGGPRVGNGLFHRLYKSKVSAAGRSSINTQRYVNRNDLVAMIPGDSPIDDALYVPLNLYGLGEPHRNVRYQHVGRTCHIDFDGMIHLGAKEFRGVGSPIPHHSKLYSERIFEAFFKSTSNASKVPDSPAFPGGW